MISQDLVLALERFVLGEILTSHGENTGRRIAVLASTCPPPMHRWFADQAHRKAALVLDQAMAGQVVASGPDLIERLSMLPHTWAVAEIAGRGRGEWEACEYDASVLASIGGYSTISDWHQSSGHRGSCDMGSCAAILRGIGQVRQLRNAIADGERAILASDPVVGPSAAWQAMIDAGNRILAGNATRTLGVCLTEAVAQAKATDAMRRAGRGASITWGVPGLDALVPMRPGGLYVLAAAPGCGKTSLALQATVATSEASGAGSVAYASLEMSGGELATIIAGRALGIAPAAIREHKDGVPWDEIERLAQEWTAHGGLLVADPGRTAERVTVESITAWFQGRHSSGGLSLCALDYLGLLDGGPRDTEYQTVTRATKALKRSALAMRVPILLLAQMNRKGRESIKSRDTGKLVADPEPTLTDLRGSGSIEQDADAVVFLHRDCAADCADPTIPMRAIVAKNRAGSQGQVPLWFQRRHQRFVPMEIPDDDERQRADRLRSKPSSTEDAFR